MMLVNTDSIVGITTAFDNKRHTIMLHTKELPPHYILHKRDFDIYNRYVKIFTEHPDFKYIKTKQGYWIYNLKNMYYANLYTSVGNPNALVFKVIGGPYIHFEAKEKEQLLEFMEEIKKRPNILTIEESLNSFDDCFDKEYQEKTSQS